MTQMTLFNNDVNEFPTSENLVMLGDRGSSKKRYLWLVEVQIAPGVYVPVSNFASPTRNHARSYAREYRKSHNKITRVTPYKACVDSRKRNNRQIVSERLDY